MILFLHACVLYSRCVLIPSPSDAFYLSAIPIALAPSQQQGRTSARGRESPALFPPRPDASLTSSCQSEETEASAESVEASEEQLDTDSKVAEQGRREGQEEVGG